MIRLRGIETAQIEIEVQDEDGHSHTDTNTHTNTTLEKEFEIHGNLEMNEGESRTFKGEIRIPEECEPTYHGIITNHEWHIEADVDIPWGKDLKESKNLYIR